MSLEIVTGRSGAGKSRFVYERIIEESMQEPDRNFFVLVPEQFTLQTQKDLTAMHPRKGLLNIDAVSFNRLAWRVFGETGRDDRPVLEELGKSLIVQRIIRQKSSGLRVLGGVLGKRGAVSQMKSLLSELMQYQVTPDMLDEWVREHADHYLLSRKLDEIREIYQSFRDYLKGRYLAAEELLQLLCEVLEESALIRGSSLVLDGFTGFTPIQYDVIERLLVLCDRVTLVVTADPEVDLTRPLSSHDLFHMSGQMVRKCLELAGGAGVEILPIRTIEPGRKSRFCRSPELEHLERGLFRYGKSPCESRTDRIEIRVAEDPGAEMVRVAAEIQRLVREEGYFYRDLAVVTGDLETYGRIAGPVFDRESIPYFMDRKRQILDNPLVEFVRSALDMLEENYSYESVFRFLRVGFSDLTREEVDRMENYVLALGIRGRKQYFEKWVRLPGRDDRDTALAEELDGVRERFVREISAFDEAMKERAGSVRHKTAALFHFLADHDLGRRLKEREEAFRRQKDLVRAQEYAQIYPALLHLFDKMVEVLGEEVMGLTAYREILEAGLSESGVGLLPPGPDQVQIGDIERTRLNHVRVLFFVGLNEGIVPRRPASKGILSEPDRDYLKDCEISLAPTSREEMYRQRFYLYLNVTKPSDRLYLSYARMSADGSALLPSYFVGVIGKLFPSLSVTDIREEMDQSLSLRLETESERRNFLLENLREGREGQELGLDFLELWNWMGNSPEGRDLRDLLCRALAFRSERTVIGRAAAEALYGRRLRNSATRLENFAACAFSHFLRYGLRLREREVYEFAPSDFGMIMHEALESFSRRLEKEGQTWSAVSEADRDRILDQALEDIVHGYGNTILHSSERNAYLIGRIRRTLRRTVWALQEQIRRGEFLPSAFEVDFSDDLGALNLSLREGVSFQLVGRIDRVDVCEKEGRRYLKIIDYKTGSVKLDLSRLYQGLQLQLALYLNAAIEADQAMHPALVAEPAGIFYYHIEDPIVEVSGREQEETEGGSGEEKAILEKLRPDGLCRSEQEILRLLDGELEAGKKSSVIPVTLKKDGTADAHSRVRSGEDFTTIRTYAAGKALELGRAMMEGEIEIGPYQYGTETSCSYCPFRGVCGYDEGIPGFRKRVVRSEREDEILKKMRGEDED